jgi:hypothetical protein
MAVGALIYLRLASLRNLVVQRVSRLRQPKYLLGAAAACAYFYFFFVRHLAFAASRSRMPGPAAASSGLVVVAIIGTVLSVLGALRIAYAWAFPPERAALRFSEAEIAFLFPAPVSRRTLLHFRLLSSQLAILLSAVLLAVVLGPLGVAPGSRILRSLGWWVILSTFDLHLNATNLTLARIREGSRRFMLWRMGAVCVMALYAVAIFWSAVGLVDAYASGNDFTPGGISRLASDIQAAPLLRWLTLPFRVVLGPYLAQSPREFLSALPAALGLMALHYLWVISSETAFEEGSIALAERRAAARAAGVRGASPEAWAPKRKPLSGPFPLGAKGPPEVAFLWKNLLSIQSAFFGRRALTLIMAIAFIGSFLIGKTGRPMGESLGTLVLVFCGIIAGYTVVLGPQLVRQDLRNDLPNMDILKTYPLPAWRLALGELLAPVAILTAVLWTLVAVAAALGPGAAPAWLTPAVRAAAALGLAAVAPFVCLTQLLVPNLLMILMPSWYSAVRSRTAGVEMFGQRMIFGVLQLFFAALVLVPAAGAAALVIFSAQWVLGAAPAVALATAAVLAILGSEVVLGLWVLGERIEGFDLSTEPR